MRTALTLAFLMACKTDADADGFSKDDCNDEDASAYPGAPEACDGVDNNCDGETDEDAVDAITFYADADADTHGDPNRTAAACEPPDGMVTAGDDCDDNEPDAFPGNVEICDGIDNNCDDDVDSDATDKTTFFLDIDKDGYGDAGSPIEACELDDGFVNDDSDCDDDDAISYPGADEICDGVDNNCAAGIDEGLDGTDEDCPATDCAALVGGSWSSGVTWIDPAGTGIGTAVYCDMVTDGGGWTLLSWTGGSEYGIGVPYPGLYVCSTLDCLRGSSAGPEVLEPLIQGARNLAIGHSIDPIASFQELVNYDVAGRYDYGSLAGYASGVGNTGSCDELALGTYHALVGDTTYDGTAVYVAQGFAYGGTYSYVEEGQYIWNIGAPTFACDGSGSAPGSWLGDWYQYEFGPTLQGTPGARSVWVR